MIDDILCETEDDIKEYRKEMPYIYDQDAPELDVLEALVSAARSWFDSFDCPNVITPEFVLQLADRLESETLMRDSD